MAASDMDRRNREQRRERTEVGPGYVQRALVALDILARTPASPDELAVALGVHRRTAVRLIDVMVEGGWVEAAPEDPRRVRLTTRVISVAAEVLNRSDLVQTSLPFVRELRDLVGESSHLSVAKDGWAVHLLEQPSPQPLNVTAHVGQRVPIHASAVGKALAAWLPEQLQLAVDRGLERFTPNTLATPESLAVELIRVREQGFVVDDGELYPDARCIAAPIRSGLGTVVAALGISGPAIRLTRDRVDGYARSVKGIAESLSGALGYSGETPIVGGAPDAPLAPLGTTVPFRQPATIDAP